MIGLLHYLDAKLSHLYHTIGLPELLLAENKIDGLMGNRLKIFKD